MSEKKTKTEKEPKKKKNCKCGTYIGGQAVLEGVMMMGKTCMATAVRDPDGAVQIEAKRIKRSDALKTASKIPLVRGVVNLALKRCRVPRPFTATRTTRRSPAKFRNGSSKSSKSALWISLRGWECLSAFCLPWAYSLFCPTIS